jgi:hypothetical protein
MKNTSRLIALCFAMFCFSIQAQTAINPSSESDFNAVNRSIHLFSDQRGKSKIHVDAKPDVGVVWIKNVEFKTGVIEFEVKGKHVLQQSFVGIAFHGTNDSTYEAVYFRPFNFQATDSIRKKHAVQYISLPKFDWSYLRETFPDKYENALLNPVNPDGWF